MDRITIEAFHDDPQLRSRLFEAANRERSRALRAGWNWLREKLRTQAPHGRLLARLG